MLNWLVFSKQKAKFYSLLNWDTIHSNSITVNWIGLVKTRSEFDHVFVVFSKHIATWNAVWCGDTVVLKFHKRPGYMLIQGKAIAFPMDVRYYMPSRTGKVINLSSLIHLEKRQGTQLPASYCNTGHYRHFLGLKTFSPSMVLPVTTRYLRKFRLCEHSSPCFSV